MDCFIDYKDISFGGRFAVGDISTGTEEALYEQVPEELHFHSFVAQFKGQSYLCFEEEFHYPVGAVNDARVDSVLATNKALIADICSNAVLGFNHDEGLAETGKTAYLTWVLIPLVEDALKGVSSDELVKIHTAHEKIAMGIYSQG